MIFVVYVNKYGIVISKFFYPRIIEFLCLSAGLSVVVFFLTLIVLPESLSYKSLCCQMVDETLSLLRRYQSTRKTVENQVLKIQFA